MLYILVSVEAMMLRTALIRLRTNLVGFCRPPSWVMSPNTAGARLLRAHPPESVSSRASVWTALVQPNADNKHPRETLQLQQ